jgi:hypothetical protein
LEQIKVTIKNGKVEMEVEGVKGTRCLELTQAIEQLVGKVDSRLLKHEFYGNREIKQTIGVKHQVSLQTGRNGIGEDPRF